MDEPKKTNAATRFKPGQSGNPNGRPKTREDLKKVKLLTSDNVRRLLQRLLDMPKSELKEMVHDPNTPMMELMIARVIDQGLIAGNPQMLNFLFDRTIGRALEHKEEAKLKPVTYNTNITVDGRLVQEIIEDEENEAAEDSDESEV